MTHPSLRRDGWVGCPPRPPIGAGLHWDRFAQVWATIEVVDAQEKLLAGQFSTDQVGDAAIRGYAKTWLDRV